MESTSINKPQARTAAIGQYEVQGYTLALYRSVDDFESVFDLIDIDNFFLSRPFLSTLEKCLPEDISVIYAVLHDDCMPLGLFYFQYKYIDVPESLHMGKKKDGVMGKIRLKAQRSFASIFNSNLLVLGNMLLTGTHGLYLDDRLSDKKKMIIPQVVTSVGNQLKKDGFPVKAFLIKDYFEDDRLDVLEPFIEFEVQPNMIFDFHDDWNSYQDYLATMKSKYRVRERRARKKAEDITVRTLQDIDLQLYRTEIHSLYRHIMTGADFNLFELPVDYFIRMQKELAGDFQVMGYFKGKRLVGFSTYLLHGDTLDAHFLGYDPDINEEHNLYLNMLYDLIFQSFKNGCRRVVFSRTAMSIKSSVGAVGHKMYLYTRTDSKLLDSMLIKALGILKPEDEWTPRSPFKT